MTPLGTADYAAIALSLKVAGVATLCALPFAFLAALALARGKFAWRVALDSLVTLPLVLPPVATGYALLLLFGRRGPIGAALAEVGIVFAFNWTGAALASAIMAFPLMVRPMRVALEAIDREVDEAAVTLGAARWVRLVRITVPLTFPGIAAAAILGFAKALGEFGATITFVAAIPGETLTLPSAIYGAVQNPGDEGRALTLCVAAAVLAVGAVVAADAVSRLALRVARGGR